MGTHFIREQPLSISRTHGKHSRQPSQAAGWFHHFFEDHHRRRLVLAFAIAIALEEIFAALVPLRSLTFQNAEQPEILTIAKLTHIEHRPTPKPIVRTHIIAPANVQPKIINPGKPSENQHVRRVASARPLVRTHYHSAPAHIHVPTGGHGAGTSKTATANTGGLGPGGTGTGESGTGSGTGGAPAAHEPCGFVDFIPYDAPTVDSSTGRIAEHITMTVHFPDGTTQSVDLDWPFTYASSAVDPFRIVTAKEATFQFPPGGGSNEPQLVQYVMQHTSTDGYTKLKECPKT